MITVRPYMLSDGDATVGVAEHATTLGRLGWGLAAELAMKERQMASAKLRIRRREMLFRPGYSLCCEGCYFGLECERQAYAEAA